MSEKIEACEIDQLQTGVRSSPGVRSATIAIELPADASDAATIPVDNDTGSNRFTTFAVANPGSEDLNIKVIILNQDGTVADSISPEELNPLRPQQQVAKFLHEILPGRLNFRGSMVLLSQGGKGFIAVALVENQGLFTAIPVLTAKSRTVPNWISEDRKIR